jgi:hypothetical protein
MQEVEQMSLQKVWESHHHLGMHHLILLLIADLHDGSMIIVKSHMLILMTWFTMSLVQMTFEKKIYLPTGAVNK